MLWFCVELPALGLEVCARRMVDESRPAVLVENNRVVARNAVALDSGVAIGSSLATAHSLCHRLEHFSRDIAAEHERLRFLADAAYRFSASISIHEPSAFLLEISGSLRLFGGLYGLKRGLISLLGELGHRAVIGIAHTPLAALALARAQENCELPRWPETSEVQAQSLKSLRRISLHHSECDSDTVERLSNMGIDTLGQLFALPTTELGRRFGPRLLDYLDRLTGQRPDPRICITPTARFTTELTFLQSISSKEALAFPMQRLAHEFCNWLIGRQLGAIRIAWRFLTVQFGCSRDGNRIRTTAAEQAGSVIYQPAETRRIGSAGRSAFAAPGIDPTRAVATGEQFVARSHRTRFSLPYRTDRSIQGAVGRRRLLRHSRKRRSPPRTRMETDYASPTGYQRAKLRGRRCWRH
jgi:protein ImuB